MSYENSDNAIKKRVFSIVRSKRYISTGNSIIAEFFLKAKLKTFFIAMNMCYEIIDNAIRK